MKRSISIMNKPLEWAVSKQGVSIEGKTSACTVSKQSLSILCMLLLSVALLLVASGCTGQNQASQQKPTTSEKLEASDHQSDAPEEPEANAGENSEGEEGEEGEQSEGDSLTGVAPGMASGTAQGAAQGSAMINDFAVLSQYPELPNGCEVTTLAAVLNYQGVYADKTVLSDYFLPKAPVGSANFYREFVGNPRESDAYGCYAPVIVTTAQSYLSSVGSGLTVYNLTGTPLDDLFTYIDKGIPVIVWATQYNRTGHYSVTWYVDGQALTWFTPEHCVTLIGYDLSADLVYVADPMTGGREAYNLSTFRANYNSLGQQAIVIL